MAEKEKGSDLYNNMPSVNDPRRNPKEFHASDLRFILVEATKSDVARKMLGDFVGGDNVDAILGILGLGNIEEISGVAVGPGIQGPPSSGSDKAARKKKRKTKQYIDLSLLAEVIELIIERGIVK